MANENEPPAREFGLYAGDIVLFFDERFPPEVYEGVQYPTNRIGVVVDENGILYIGRGLLGKKVERIGLDKLLHLQNVEFRRSTFAEHASAISAFFLRNQHSPLHCQTGLNALFFGNMDFFKHGWLYPPPPAYKSDAEYEKQWSDLVSVLQPMDLIFTIDQSSTLSRFIAWATHGPWSHVAIHTGSGMIWESVTSGIRHVGIDAYKGRNFRVAAYRHMDTITDPITQERAEETVSSHPFKPNRYNYRGAIKFGLKTFFGDHTHNLVPNNSMYQGNLIYVGQA